MSLGEETPAASTRAGVRLVELEKRYGDVTALQSLDLEVEAGELMVLLGPSGCGKTTALRLIAGLEEPTRGEIYIEDRLVNEIEPAQRDIAMVFQNYALYPHMSVRENLAFALRMRKAPREELERKLRWAASILGLESLLDRRPGQLSGGQRQRVALGRALVREPAVFLFDEPLSNLDARLRLEMRAEIAELHRKLGATMVFVTHDQREAMSLGRRIAIMKAGALQQVGAPLEVYEAPANRFVAEFIGSPPINTVRGEVVREGGVTWFRAAGLELPFKGVSTAGEAVLGVRPEGLKLCAPGGTESDFAALVRRVEPLGSETHVQVTGPAETPWVVRAGMEEGPFREGESVGLRLDRSRIHLFAGPEGRRVTT